MKKNINKIFKENEDERIRKEMIFWLKGFIGEEEILGYTYDEIMERISYLERIGSQNLTNSEKICKVKPRFKLGDWLQYRNAKPFFVEEITEQGYVNGNSCLPFEWENEIHVWTIQDAKDGDVLATDLVYFIFKSKDDIGCYMHCSYSVISDKFNTSDTATVNSEYVHPVTQEQHDLLFQKMNKSGYKWNEKKKCLKELAPNKFDINTLIPFESRVLVRNGGTWQPAFWGYYSKEYAHPYVVTGGNTFEQCIPYEHNEHLRGTTNECDEYFKIWK